MKTLATFISLALLGTVLTACNQAEQAGSVNTPGLTLAQSISQTAQNSLQAFNIPGIAVVAVQDGQVILAEGFGVRDLQTGQPVTADTLFGVASHTKAFTAAALAVLVQQGKLNWDDKVVQHLPEFRLSDEAISQRITIRDLLSHRTGLGLGAGDLMIWPDTDKTPEQILAGLAQVPLAKDLRQGFAYNNLAFVAAGLLIERVCGMAYHQFVAQHFFQPLNMQHSVVGLSQLNPAHDNIAVGSIEYQGTLHPFPLDYLEDFAAAGATLASANDMGKWLQALLNEGKSADGQAIIAPEQLAQMWQLITPLPVAAKAGLQSTHFRGYGMGWFVKDYHGVKQIYHSGGILGMLSLTTLVPEKNFAITVLTNQQAFEGLTTITEEALEQVLALPDTDWLGKQQQQYKKFMQHKASFTLPPAEAPAPALALSQYAGNYQDNWYGKVTISETGGTLRIRFAHTQMLSGELQHYDGNTFIVRWDQPLLEADAYIRFSAEQGQIKSATMQAVADFTDFSFDFHNLTLRKLEAPQ